MSDSLDFRMLEEKWQRRWADAKIFESNPDGRRKYYLTVAYPYPNAPQHIGHARTYTLADVHARYMRMKGYNTLLPMAFHYTGTPLLGMSKRIASGDPEVIGIIKDIYGVPEDVIKTFNDPLNIAKYFHSDIKLGMQMMGFSIDWRREFTTIDPTYSKFIEWQFHKLNSKGLITKGAHPVGWCPSCNNPVGQHDTLHDKEPDVGEFTAIMFSMGGVKIPTATLRPETIFGVTNIWINPEATYVKVSIKGEPMIISRKAAEKLTLQVKGLSQGEEMKGSTLVGRNVKNPMTGSEIVILPAEFVDPSNATGVVMSVPAHAPFDLLALRDLKAKPDALKAFHIAADSLERIHPIPVVALEGASEIPAQDVIDAMKVKDQLDPKAEGATKDLYQREFHCARMRPETGKYAGMPVSKAKDLVKKDLMDQGDAFPFFEILNGPIHCRCGAEVTVNLLSDQWFINYGDEAWKAKVRDHLLKMSLLPEDLRQEFDNVVDWLREKACARRSGLGTHLPWDKDWIIESLSDSTIYMAYYTISRIINRERLEPSLLTDKVFDYIFLGLGDSKTLGMREEVLEEMREEFKYFYPLDSRHSGRDLVPNHLTFFIFNHTAIFPEEKWPRQIAVNGSVLMDGKKMSKSLGNIIPLRKAIGIYGADTLRVSILSASELLQDADFSDSSARGMHSKLQEFYSLAIQYSGAGSLDHSSMDPLDTWLVSRVQKAIAQTTCSMDCLRVREALHNAFFALQQDLSWYFKRRGNYCTDPKTRSAVKYSLGCMIKMMAPFAPHLCEELWERFGNEGFIATAAWPASDNSLISETAEVMEDYLKGVVADGGEIVKVTCLVPSKIFFYTSPDWKWEVYLKLLSLLEGGADPKALIREAMKDLAIRGRGGEAAKFINSISQSAISMPSDQRKRLLSVKVDELGFLKANLGFLEAYFKCPVEVQPSSSSSYDPKRRAGMAAPMRPAIYLEGSTCSE
jgi:leucyl-tRNA synthetase